MLWPAAGFTKGAMVEYYRQIAPVLVPHLAGRPLTLRRFPDGVDGSSWFQNDCPGGGRRPPWVRVEPYALGGGREWDFCVVEDERTLLWVANWAAIELHPFLATVDRPREPTAVVFDLDPGPPADFADCCRVALRLRAALEELGLASFAKTSGSVGLHVYVPLAPGRAFAETKSFARSLAARLAEEDGGVVDRQDRAARAGKVLVDWLQNDPARSTVAPYSLRALGWPTVATPLTWEEVEAARELVLFEPQDVLRRVERVGDLFAPVLSLPQSLS